MGMGRGGALFWGGRQRVTTFLSLQNSLMYVHLIIKWCCKTSSTASRHFRSQWQWLFTLFGIIASSPGHQLCPAISAESRTRTAQIPQHLINLSDVQRSEPNPLQRLQVARNCSVLATMGGTARRYAVVLDLTWGLLTTPQAGQHDNGN